MYEKRSRWFSVTWNVCIPPIDSPAIARWSRSAIVRKVESTNGIRASVRSASKADAMSSMAFALSGEPGGFPVRSGAGCPARRAYP
jgi:hypothetical protein